MKEKADKHIEKLVDKVMQSSTLETPTFDFTSKVMSQVSALSQSKVTVYRPLISKTAWFAIITSFIGIIVYLVWSMQPEPSGFMESIDFGVISNNKLTNLFSSIKLPQMTFYAVLILGIMFLIQVPILKHHFNKRLQL